MREMKKLIALLIALLLGSAAAESEMPIADDAIKVSVAHIRVAGDVMAHDHQLRIALQSDGSYDFSDSFEKIAPVLQNADYTIANLETVIAPDRPYTGYPVFNTPPTLLDALKNVGVDFLTLANNHMLDGGFNGLVSTVDAVEAAGFDHAGAYRSAEEAKTPTIVNVNGICLGFLCYTETANGNEKYNQRAREYGLKLMSRANYAKDVQTLREAGADFIICLPHWGTEYKREPDAEVRRKAKELVSAGVDIIIGSHPHVVQPIETLTVESEDGGEKSAIVVWSLGNFLSNMYKQYTYSGIIFDFVLEKTGNGACVVRESGYLPVYVLNREKIIQLFCSSANRESKPTVMTSGEFVDMRTTYDEITKLIGEDFNVLEK